jgi:hypothetical protein
MQNARPKVLAAIYEEQKRINGEKKPEPWLKLEDPQYVEYDSEFEMRTTTVTTVTTKTVHPKRER